MAVPAVASNPLAQRLLDVFDSDQSGDVDFKEFLICLSAFSTKGKLQDKLRCVWSNPDAFQVYDIDRDGFISNGELFLVLKMMVGDNLLDDQLQQIVDKTIIEADTDNDGKVSFDEFLKMVATSDIMQQLTIESNKIWSLLFFSSKVCNARYASRWLEFPWFHFYYISFQHVTYIARLHYGILEALREHIPVHLQVAWSHKHPPHSNPVRQEVLDNIHSPMHAHLHLPSNCFLTFLAFSSHSFVKEIPLAPQTGAKTAGQITGVAAKTLGATTIREGSILFEYLLLFIQSSQVVQATLSASAYARRRWITMTAD